MAWAATVQAIRSSRADIMYGNMGWTKARVDVMLPTDSIYYGANFITMLKDRPTPSYIDPIDLKGSSVGAITDTSYVPDLRKIPGIKEVKLYDNVDSWIRDIVAGRVDTAVLDSMNVDYLQLQQLDLAPKQVPVKSNEHYPTLSGKGLVVMQMSLETPDLIDAVNTGVKWLQDTKKNADLLAQNGMTSPDYGSPTVVDRRLGVDHDAAGAILGPAAHTPKDYSAYFA